MLENGVYEINGRIVLVLRGKHVCSVSIGAEAHHPGLFRFAVNRSLRLAENDKDAARNIAASQ